MKQIFIFDLMSKTEHYILDENLHLNTNDEIILRESCFKITCKVFNANNNTMFYLVAPSYPNKYTSAWEGLIEPVLPISNEDFTSYIKHNFNE